VLSLSFNLTHSRINNWKYHAIKEIIKNDLAPDDISSSNVSVFPNPVSQSLQIKGVELEDIVELRFFDNTGKQCSVLKDVASLGEIDVSQFTPGIYHLMVSTREFSTIKKVIKVRD